MRSRLVGLSLLACVLVCQQVHAQSDSVTVKKITYYNSFVSGVLVGCGLCNEGKDFTYSFLTLHGMRISSRVKFSLGVGMDVYSDWRLFPVVAGFTFDPYSTNNSVFFHVNAGHAWGRYLSSEPYLSDQISAQGGFTINPMLGYRIGNDKLRIYIQAGYKIQLAYTEQSFPGWSQSRSYELKRFVIQFGFGFN